MESLHSWKSDDLDLPSEQQQILPANPSVQSDTSSLRAFTEMGALSGEYNSCEITVANPSIVSTDTSYPGRDYLTPENSSLVAYAGSKTTRDNDIPGVSTDEQLRSQSISPHVSRYLAEVTDLQEKRGLQSYVTHTGEKNSTTSPQCNLIAIPKLEGSFVLLSFSEYMKLSGKNPTEDTSRGQVSHNPYDECEEVVQCEACHKDFRLLETYCSTCELWICQSCAEAHKLFPQTSSHRLIADMEFKEQCTAIARRTEKDLQNMEQRYKEQSENVVHNLTTCHSDVEIGQEQIKAATEDDLLQELTNYKKTFMLSHMGQSQIVKEDMLRFLNGLRDSSSGLELKDRVNIVMDSLVALTVQGAQWPSG